MKKKAVERLHVPKPNTKGTNMKKSSEISNSNSKIDQITRNLSQPSTSYFDQAAKHLSQPRTFLDVLTSNLVPAVGTVVVVGAAYVALKALDAEATSVVQHRDAKRLTQGKNEFGNTYQIREILSDEDKDRLQKPLLNFLVKNDLA